VLLAGCNLTGGSGTRWSPPPGVGCKTPSTKQQVFAALYSVYYREQQAGAHGYVRGAPALPLETAAEFLRCDPDLDVRKARIRRAAISLASSIILLRCKDATKADQAEFFRALAILGVPKPKLLVKKLDRRLSCAGITPPGVNDAAGDVIDKTKELEDLQRSCCPCITDCEIGPWGQISVAEFEIEVNRDSSCIFQVIDPQCWDNVVPLNFENTYVMSPPCVGGYPACRTTTSCTTAPGPIALMPAPTPTTAWCGNLSEIVITAAYDISTRLETVLKVKTARSIPGAFTMDYGLCESRGWNICDPACIEPPSATLCTPVCNTGDCAIERDCGWADVQPKQQGVSVLSGQKQLQFSAGLKPDLNAWAQLALKVMVGEVADATCRPASACAGALPGLCPTTALPTSAMASTTSTPQCTCTGPVDSCTLVQEMKPKPAAFCPPQAQEDEP
jgi:hypothetical protein